MIFESIYPGDQIRYRILSDPINRQNPIGFQVEDLLTDPTVRFWYIYDDIQLLEQVETPTIGFR